VRLVPDKRANRRSEILDMLGIRLTGSWKLPLELPANCSRITGKFGFSFEDYLLLIAQYAIVPCGWHLSH
jgi:hypothetical protein